MTYSVRPLQPDDQTAWRNFAADIPAGEERFFKEDIGDDANFQRWSHNPGLMVAVTNGTIAGAVAMLPGRGWSSHVAELRLIVGGSYRRAGIGRALARQGLVHALEHGCTHVFAEVIAEQAGLIAMFGALGFRPEALLEDFVRDGDGQPHDLMVLTHRVADNWSALAGLGLAEASQ